MPGNYQKGGKEGGTPKLYITWTDFIMYSVSHPCDTICHSSSITPSSCYQHIVNFINWPYFLSFIKGFLHHSTGAAQLITHVELECEMTKVRFSQNTHLNQLVEVELRHLKEFEKEIGSNPNY
jgi:hypothetical protein